VCLNIMHDWFGWLLLLFSFGIVLMWKSIRDDTKVVLAIWFCLVLHHAVALLNVYVGAIIGADVDALNFHAAAVNLAALPEPVWFFGVGNGLVTYTHSLGLLYRAFGASLIFGGELSVLAFAMSCIVLVKLLDLLDLRRFRVGIILLFGLLPSAVIFRSATLRESWQALFFLLCVYWAIRLRKPPGILIFSFMLMSALCMATLHYCLSNYAAYLIVISVYWRIFGRKKGILWARPVKFMFTGLLVACVIMLTLKIGRHGISTYSFQSVGQTLKEVENFRLESVTILGRTTYGVMLDTSSVYGLVTTIPMVFVQYMFAPFPWQIEKVVDIPAMLESMLRIALMFFALSSWRKYSGEVRNYYGFLLIAVLGMELVWALGTVNWGTAVRHHVPGYGVIVLLGAPGLILFMRRLHFGIFGRRKVSIFKDREEFVKSDPKINEIS